MCCFSQPVRHVSRTRIFARPVDPVRQLLVYSMRLAADADLAMVLPIPVPPSSPEDAVRFIDMSSAPKFFDDLDLLFPEPKHQGFGTLRSPGPAYAPQPLLVVHEVGDFEASFVPTRADFARLDPRFQLPSSVWDALPEYRDWGFCVFKLRLGAQGTAAPHEAPTPPPGWPGAPAKPGLLDRVLGLFGNKPLEPPPSALRDFHPMAFEFPRRQLTHLFFPTVHIHDGAVHPTAAFSHTLYAQGASDSPALRGEWRCSAEPAGALGGASVTWLDRDRPVYRTTMLGDRPNKDVYLEAYASS